MRNKLVLIGLFLTLSGAYFWAIFGTFAIPFCCDSNTHLWGGYVMRREGLLFDNPLLGYRSYFNFAAAELVRAIGSAFVEPGPPGTSPEYTVGALLCFAVAGCALVLLFSDRAGFLPVFAATYLLPFSIAYAPYPLQESQLAIFLAPVLVTCVVLLSERKLASAITALIVFASLAWMIRSSFTIMAALVSALAVWLAVRSKLWRPLAAGAVLAAAIIAPQSYTTVKRIGTAYPFPNNDVLAVHIMLGHRTWRYETTLIGGEPGREMKFAPFPPIGAPGQLLDRALSDPLQIAALGIGHAIGSFDYSQMRVYITEPRHSQFSVLNIAVGATLFLGLLRWARLLAHGPYTAADIFIDACLIGSFAFIPFITVETRFSYIATLGLCSRAFEWVCERDRTIGQRAAAAAAALAFGTSMSILIGLMNGPPPP